jgi:hypothetical protein
MPDSLLGKVRDRVIWPGRAELATAVGSPTVVVGLVLGQDCSQVRWPKISIRSVTSVRAVSANLSA